MELSPVYAYWILHDLLPSLLSFITVCQQASNVFTMPKWQFLDCAMICAFQGFAYAIPSAKDLLLLTHPPNITHCKPNISTSSSVKTFLIHLGTVAYTLFFSYCHSALHFDGTHLTDSSVLFVVCVCFSHWAKH